MAAKTPAEAKPARERSDAELIAAARRGDDAAFDALAGRHRDAAERLARRIGTPNVEDLVSDAIASAGAALRAGTGPAAAFRPYLLTTLRRRNYARAKAAGKVRGVDDLAPGRFRPIVDSPVRAEFLARAAAAYRELPEPAQAALWHTEVEDEPLLETGRLLGLPGAATAELAFGARDGIRAAFLGAHRSAISAGPCRWTTDRLGAHARTRLPARDSEKVAEHLAACTPCGAVYPAVAAVETDLAALIAAVVLGAAAGPYLGRETVPAARARLALAGGFGGRARALTAGSSRSAALIGAGVLVLAAGVLVSTTFAGEGVPGANTAEDSPASFTLSEVENDRDDDDDDGPSSGFGSTGRDRAPARAVTQPPPEPRPIPVPPRTESPAATTPASAPERERPERTARAAQPAAPDRAPEQAPAEEEAAAEQRTLDLGVAAVGVTPQQGPLGLPEISLDSVLLD